ncbi:Histidine kinase-, DNA gyrase B-, and HSP90-like ATPase [Actinomadura rubteroloni]|uniref:histidine kinase n=1 Tax=Actinomadura rubteroloni TaxID=1926885 RepID=A0A2P4UKU6_9ACTN|nr:ATP-binding protein [Actinomadura rubteroloni]POM25609.1 Histidine kinase-, DNA gyrase B-, and HSP90-like ATPase [Actinomadura rubteroloni]
MTVDRRAPERPAAPPPDAPRGRDPWGPASIAAAVVLALLMLTALLLLATGAGVDWPVPFAATALAAALVVTLVLRDQRDRDERDRLRAEAARRAAELAAETDRARAAAQRLAEWETYADALRQRSRGLEELTRRILLAYLPAVVDGDHLPRVGPEAADLLGPELAETLRDALRSVLELRRDLADREDSYQQVMVALAQRVQSASHRMQLAAERIAEDNRLLPDVYRAGQAMDHAASQAARVAQSVAILSGSWEGQQWTRGLRLAEIVQAASARIEDYGRVRIEGDPDVGVDPVTLEPVIHVIAELLANATEASPTATDVIVKVSAAASGAVFRIDDHGTGLEEPRLSHARDVVAGRLVPTLADLGEVPRTGLAVVGRYAAEHRLKVTLDESPYGGLQAVVLVPSGRTIRVEPRGARATAPLPRPSLDRSEPSGSRTPPTGTPARPAGRSAGAPSATPPAGTATPPTGTPAGGPSAAPPPGATGAAPAPPAGPSSGRPDGQPAPPAGTSAAPPPGATGASPAPPHGAPGAHAVSGGAAAEGPHDAVSSTGPHALPSSGTAGTPPFGSAAPDGGEAGGGLPQRRNRRRAAVPPPSTTPAVAPPDQTPEDAASFMAGVFGGAPPVPDSPDDDPGEPRE